MTQFIVGKHKGQRALYRLSGAFLTFLAYLPAQAPRMPTFVYVDAQQGGFQFGMDARTPVEWTFTRGSRYPRTAYVAMRLAGSSTIDYSKLAAMPRTFIGSEQALRAALKKDAKTA